MRRLIRSFIISVLLWAGLSVSAAAQFRSAPAAPPLLSHPENASPFVPTPPASTLWLWGLGSGVVSAAGGAATGAILGALSCFGGEECARAGISVLTGQAVAVSAVVPAVVHRANQGRGQVAISLLATAGVGVLGLGVSRTLPEPDRALGVLAVALPLAQISTAVLVERATTRR